MFSYITLVLGVVFVTIVSWKIYNGKLGHMFLFSSIYFMCINYLDFFLIHSNFNVEFPSNSDIQSQDICAILSNLLDNAIEACEKNKVASNKWINLTIRVINAMIVIKVENSMEVKPIIKNNNLLTSKADDKLHGWGIKIVKSAVEKYGGVIKYTVSEDKFRVVVTLNYNKSEEYYRINE